MYNTAFLIYPKNWNKGLHTSILQLNTLQQITSDCAVGFAVPASVACPSSSFVCWRTESPWREVHNTTALITLFTLKIKTKIDKKIYGYWSSHALTKLYPTLILTKQTCTKKTMIHKQRVSKTYTQRIPNIFTNSTNIKNELSSIYSSTGLNDKCNFKKQCQSTPS